MDFSKYTKQGTGSCESCEHYQYDEYTYSYYCSMNLDEDEMSRFMERNTRGCHYYKFYDEYKSVQRQI